MKNKQSVRRLVALTLATAVTIPQASPVFAASAEIGKTAQTRLVRMGLSTPADRKWMTGGGDKFPQLIIPQNFRSKTLDVTSVTKPETDIQKMETPKLEPETTNVSISPPIEVTNGNNKLQVPTVIAKAEDETTDSVTKIDEEALHQTLLPELPPEAEKFSLASDPENGGEEPVVDNCGSVGAEEITDVTNQESNEGIPPLFGDVVMPPEATILSSEDPVESAADIPDDGGDDFLPDQPENTLPSEPPEELPDGDETTGAEELPPVANPEPLPEEPPVEVPVEPVALPVERANVLKKYNYSIGFGVPVRVAVEGGGEYHATLTEYGEEFQVETSIDPYDESGEVEISGLNPTDYGFRKYNDGALNDLYDYELLHKENGETISYCVFPSVANLGRIPDKVFDGWYLYRCGIKMGRDPSDAEIRSWVYDYDNEDNMIPVSLMDYVTGDWGYDAEGAYGVANSVLGDTWDGGQSYYDWGYRTSAEDSTVYRNNPVSFVGKWRGSDESRAADIDRVKDERTGKLLESAVTLTVNGERLPLYSSDILGLFGTALAEKETDFDRGAAAGAGAEYWLRVPADVDSLDLEFNAAEIFYDYNGKTDKSGLVSPVQITWKYGSEQSVDYSVAEGDNSRFSAEMLPKAGWKDDGATKIPNNSPDNPAYSRWSVTGIALLPSSVGEGDEGYRYNDITITVAPPSVYEKQLAGEELTEEDKGKITTYTFHVQRLTEPTLQQSPGNTPLGMIQRDTGGETEFDRAAATEKFLADYRFSTLYGEYPRSQVNNGGSIFRDTYTPSAWASGATNVDLDPEAIVVYQNSAFQDPGIALTDSEGQTVRISKDSPWVVQRILKLKMAEELTIPNLTKGVDRWYQGGQLLDTTAGEILSGANDQIDLRGLKVLPGIYTLEYEIYDPVADKTYDSNAENENSPWVTDGGRTGAVKFRRTLVVLPIPGDVDMDGAVTSADAEVLRRYLTDAQTSPVAIPAQLGGTPLGTDPTVDLFAYRVADGDHDGTLDKRVENSTKVTDVDMLEALPRAQLTNISESSSKSDYYYLPLPNTVEAVKRQSLHTDAGAEGPRLELVYLGKEASRTVAEGYEDGYISNPLGPWREGGAWITGTNSTERMELFDTMWVGVKLTNSTASELLAKRDVDTFTFSLVYDIRYLDPAEVLTQNEWDAIPGKEKPEERWKATLRLYNTSGKSQTVWGRDNSYVFTRALQSGRSFATYDSKAITPLEEAAMDEGRTSHLRELVFSITLDDNMLDGGKARLDSNGDLWLLAVPFTLVQHPVGKDEFQGVEMQAGMSDFTLLFQKDGELTTAAYNPLVEDIFGGNTANLATSVTYANAGPKVPLGKDNSQVFYIRNEPQLGVSSNAGDVVYSTPFQAQLGWEKQADGSLVYKHNIPARSIMRYNPEWLHYDNTSGRIYGTPEAAGTYYFTVANYRYQLDVVQAPLHYWADSQSSYYGEDEFRGSNSTDFTFRYTTSEIQSLDQARAEASGGTIRNDGRGESLADLLADEKYRAPKFTAVDDNGQTVLAGTEISEGAYPIKATVAALSNNYNMIYSPEMGDGEKGLTVLPRPFQVEKLLVKNVGKIYSDQTAGTIPGLKTTLDSNNLSTAGFDVKLMDPLPDDKEDHYSGLPLKDHSGYVDGVLMPGDSLILEYEADLLQTETDKALSGQGGGRYALTEPEEDRTAQISGLRIVGGKNSKNYTIFDQKEPVINGEEAGVVGTVRRRKVIRFTFVRVPPLEYHTGDQLARGTELWFNIVKEGDRDNVEGDYPYNEETTLLRHGVTVTWATKEEMEDGKKGSLDYKLQQTFTMDYNGRYLCMSSGALDEEGRPEIVVYYPEPLKIIPRNLTLTAVEASRFYGEENGELKFTYDPRQLSVEHQERMRDLFGGSVDGGPRDGAELEQILVPDGKDAKDYYREPTLTAVDDVETRVPLDKDSKYTGSTTNAVLIQGAWSKEYKIDYSYTSKGTTVVQEDWGASPFSISRRVIVVEALRKTERTQNLTTIYADTKRIYTEKLTLDLEDVILSLPKKTAEGGVEYYPRYGAVSPIVVEKGYATEEALVGGDQVSFVYTATMASQDGADYVKWTSFSKGHFNMDGADANGDKKYPVQVGRITLTGPDANNYELVFKDNTSATLEAPTLLETVGGCIDPNVNARKNYYIPQLVQEGPDGTLTRTGRGEGTVTLRPIERMEIVSTGKLDYIYGDVYVPDQAGGSKNLGLQIHIEYAKDYDNYTGNVTSGTLEFKVSRYEDGRPVTTFDERGLAIYYQPGGETTGVDESQRLAYREALSIDPHDGAYLVVAGKRAENHEEICSLPSGQALRVRPKTLTLRPMDQYRVYGEDNPGDFPFEFNVNELAPQDQEKLGATSGWQNGTALTGLGLDYTAPAFKTDAQRKSDVKNGGRGGYDIYVDAGRKGELENYQLEFERGTLYIYPRRVQIDRFLKEPIYTIYSDIDANIVYTNAFIDQAEGLKEFTLKLAPGEYRPDGAPGALPITGEPLVSGDSMSLKLEIGYPADWKASSEKSFQVTVQNASFLPGTREYSNYELDTAGGVAVIHQREAKGDVELRSITNIEITGTPFKTEYDYGETLDLTGLTVTISYQVGNDESNIKHDTIPYRQTEDFASHGLYVNYYPYREITAEDKRLEAEARPEFKLRNRYYTAGTGDHVTIAPTHDSMTKAVGDPKREFSANGQYLVVTAQRDSEHKAAEPILVKKDGKLVQIKVNPRPVEFSLLASDKTYDGSTRATGALTIENAYRQQGYVDAFNRDVTDMVYPVTGADHEALWGEKLTAAGDKSFSEYIEEHGGSYKFATGGAGYEHDETPAPDTMTFSFLDPNVAYEDGEPTDWDVYGRITSKEVQVKGLRLAGADAANYVLRTSAVTPENVGQAAGYQGGSLPRATIRKADRAPMGLDVLPKVEVDPNTNVVRIVYDQSLSAISGGEQPQYMDELHFEYALQYDATEKMPELPEEPEIREGETTLVVEQWAGPRGGQLWWDETYFGGEAVTIEYPEGYLPLEKDIPQGGDSESKENNKGQVYAWAGEDPRFLLDGEAYPGDSGQPWPGYELYKTDRTALSRGQIYWPVVRVAETHNYNASPAISSAAGYTPEMIQAVLAAKAALKSAANDDQLAKAQEAMTAAAGAALTAMGEALDGAREDAAAESGMMAEAAESGKWPEDWAGRASAPAVKTYAQSLELVSVKELEGAEPPAVPPEEAPEGQSRAAGDGKNTYQIPTLEAVWFTDVQQGLSKKLLDAVARNMSPVRYQEYAWDPGQTAPLFAEEQDALSLEEPLLVEVTQEDEQGNEITSLVRVNEDSRARIYVELRSSSGGGSLLPVTGIRIDSEDLTVRIGAEPVQLRAIIEPENATNRTVRWSSSDETVARVDRNGQVTFVGIGIAVITATSVEGLSDSITVTVKSDEDWRDRFPNSIFNMGLEEPFFPMGEKDMLFHPQWEMTRGEAAQLLARFYLENPNWTRKGPADFPDLTGEESYAPAARLLGSKGVFVGLPDGCFGGEQTITRAEFIVLLTRMTGVEIPDTTGEPHAFLDTGEEDTWAYREIDAMRDVPGILLGVGEGYFAPTRPITRAESTVFLTRMLEFPLVGEEPLIPKDVGENHWARGSILRAVNRGIAPEK